MNVPSIETCLPANQQILIERLTAQEASGITLTITDKAEMGAPQAYILAIGPRVPEDLGFKVGDRVILQGTYVPVPKYGMSHRERGLVDIHNIRGVLKEKSLLEIG